MVSGFLEIFQKPPDGLFIAARRRISFLPFLGFWRETAWRWTPNR